MTLKVRPATEQDASLISQLAHKIWHEHYPAIISVEQIDFMLQSRYSEKVIEEQMDAGEKFFLAYLEDEPVAYASIELKNDHYYMHKFYVAVPKHRSGIGHEFFNNIMLRTDPTKPYKLQVNRQNYKAVNFYFKMGFVINSIGDFDIGGGYFMNDFVMVRHV